MTKLIIFDKDGVILDLEATWLPVVRSVAAYTLNLLPPNISDKSRVTQNDLLLAIGVDESHGSIDPKGLFAAGSFSEIKAKWQKMLPTTMISLKDDPTYGEAVENIILRLVRGNTKAKGDVVTPLKVLHKNGYMLAIVTNDSENSAIQNLHDLDIADLFYKVVGANSGFGSKPEPAGLLHCCEVAGVLPRESIMVGDTIADYEASVTAGCKAFICVADSFESIPHNNIPSENVIPNISELPALLGSK